MKKAFLLSLFVLGTIGSTAQTNNEIKFTAKIANRISDTLVIRGANNFKHIIPINKENLFVSNFLAPKDFYVVMYDKQRAGIYLKPNSEVNLTADAKEFVKTSVYSGIGVKESNFLVQYQLKSNEFKKSAALIRDPSELASFLNTNKKIFFEDLEKEDYDSDFKKDFRTSIESLNKNTLKSLESFLEKSSKVAELKGKASPDFDYENYKGGKTKLSDLKGKYVFIDIWATWCAPCRAEIPFLKKLEEKYHEKNIEFVSLSIDKVVDNKKWKKFVLDNNLGGIQLVADKDWKSKFLESYKVKSIPWFILIDPNGIIVDANMSRPSSPKLEEDLDKLLK